MININSFEEFKKSLALRRQWIEEWSAAYADSDFRDRQLVKCFYHYKDKPMSEGDWKRVIDSWFEKNWTSNSFNSMKPKLQKRAVEAKPVHTGVVDQWQPIREKLPLRNHHCPKCFSSGIVEAYRAGDKYQFRYCFVCYCDAGKLASQLPENMPSKIRSWRDVDGEWINSLDKDECPY